jgi:hypothetical protein
VKSVNINLITQGGRPNDIINIPLSDFRRYDNLLLRRPWTFNYGGGAKPTTGPNLWGWIKSASGNPSANVWIYTHGGTAYDPQTTVSYITRDTIARVTAASSGSGVADNPLLGALDGSPSNAGSDSFGTYANKDYLLRTSGGTPILAGSPLENVMRVGDPGYQRFWTEALRQDLRVKGGGHVGRGATGMHTDLAKAAFGEMGMNGTPGDPAYANSINAWTDRMIEFYKGIAKRLAHTSVNLKLQSSTGVRLPEQQKLWRALNSATPAERPFQMVTEKMFVIDTSTDIEFTDGSEWETAVQMLDEINNIEVASSNAQRIPAGAVDQFGAAVSVERALRYALCSFLIVKRTNKKWYFSILWNSPGQTATLWQPEYTALNGGRMMVLGVAVNPADPGTGITGLRTTTINGARLYVREYTRGAVIVHPRLGTSPGNSATINFTTLFGKQARVVTRANIGASGTGTTLPALTNTFTLAPLNGVFLRF